MEPTPDDEFPEVHHSTPKSLWYREVLDYRFVIAFTLLLLASTAVWGFVQRQQEANSLATTARVSALNISVLTNRVDDLNTTLAKERAAAQRSRALLHQQNRELTKTLRTLVAYLRAHGIEVPRQFTSGGGRGGSSGSPHRPQRHKPKSSAPPVGPGNSGAHPCKHRSC